MKDIVAITLAGPILIGSVVAFGALSAVVIAAERLDGRSRSEWRHRFIN